MVTHNDWGQNLGCCVIRDQVTEVVTLLATLDFSPCWAKGAIGKTRSDRLADHVKPSHLSDYLARIIQIDLEINKHPTLFYLKDGKR